jgi:hypothetical protein
VIVHLLLTGLLLVSGFQSGPEHLLIVSNGDLWTWNPASEALTQRSEGIHMRQPALSPDGLRLAYSTDEAAYFRGSRVILYNGTPPADIWIMELASGATTHVATQPESRAYAIQRSGPVWSPDSQQITWVEEHQVVIYDVAQGVQSVFSRTVDYGYQDAGIALPELQWGATISSDVLSFGNPDGTNLLYLYTSAEPELHIVGDIHHPGQSTSTHRWVFYQDRWWVGLPIGNGDFHLLDPQSGERFLLDAAPRLQLLNPPANAIYLNPHLDDPEDWWKVDWTVITPDGEAGRIETDRFGHIPAISPDGQQVAYLSDEWVMLWENGDTRRIFQLEGRFAEQAILWTPMQWRADGSITPVDAPKSFPSPTPGRG